MAVADDLKWKTWQDWVNLIAGVVLALSPLWVAYGAASYWPIIAGIVIAVVGLWALATAASQAAEWVQIVVAVITFILPWIGGFSAESGAWWAWILGVVVFILGIWALVQYKRD